MIKRYENLDYHGQRQLADEMDAERTRQEKYSNLSHTSEGVWKGNLYFESQEKLDLWNRTWDNIAKAGV